MKRVLNFRSYCISVAKNVEKEEDKLNFAVLRHITKVPDHPVNEEFTEANIDTKDIDKKTILLLERLALVNLDGEEALKTLKNSIQFAKRIEGIDTTDKKPLYTVLEEQPLQLRSDKVSEGNCREEILRNAKISEDDYFISPPGNIPLKQEEENKPILNK